MRGGRRISSSSHARLSTLYMYRGPAFSCHNIISTSRVELYYANAIKLLKSSLRGARQSEAVLALRPSGKSLSTELWILLASWLRLRLRLGGGRISFSSHTRLGLGLVRLRLVGRGLRLGGGGSVLVATPDSGLRLRLRLRLGGEGRGNQC